MEVNMDLPTFCPNPNCIYHNRELDYSNNYYTTSTYTSKAHGATQCFRCKLCKKSFSEQTFRVDYYAKKVIDYQQLMNLLTSCSSIRTISSFLNVSLRTIQNKIERLGRQVIAVQCKLMSDIKLNEDIVADGFESFSVSQYFPNNIHLSVGKDSQFIYYLNYASIRRKGRMTAYQKEKREVLEKKYKAEPKEILNKFTELLNNFVNLSKNSHKSVISLFTDEKYDYKVAWNKNSNLKDSDKFKHIRVNSKKKRNMTNQLFSVNYIDKEIRKDLAEHVRETTRFGRNITNAMNRLIIYQFWHNTQKQYRINQPKAVDLKHFEVAGGNKTDWLKEIQTIYKIRRFKSHITALEKSYQDIWLKKIKTPLKQNAEYLPKFAVA